MPHIIFNADVTGASPVVTSPSKVNADTGAKQIGK